MKTSSSAQIAEEEDTNPTLEEALNGDYAEEWHKAMQSEYEAFVKNGAWKLVKRPQNYNRMSLGA